MIKDTIAAIATPIGTAGIGVIRVSGQDAMDIAYKVFRPVLKDFPTHTLHHGKIIHPVSADVIDDAVLAVFRAPKSYTGEDVAEISCHGGMAVLRAVLQAVLDSGARLAEPGEFTKRAFLNGKLDLAQAEAVNDLIRATTDGARKVALRQLDGKLSSRIRNVNQRILGIIAAVEAAIDFPEDVPEPEYGWVVDEINSARDIILEMLSTFGKGRIYREGLRMVIAGRVNVGKSSLMNALLRHARAIVTPIPGTTRDVIEETLEIHGIPVVAIDTAGLRKTDDPVEKIGVELTEQSLEQADMVLLVIDASVGVTEEDAALMRKIGDKPAAVVLNKTDLLSENDCRTIVQTAIDAFGKKMAVVQASAASGVGIEDIEDAVEKLASARGTAPESEVVTNIRHKESLKSALESLGQALATAEALAPIDLLSVDLTAARNSLGLITGETAGEDLIDRIFSEFCIGK